MGDSTGVIDRGAEDVTSDWIARLRMLPDDCRDFSVSARRAELEFGIEEAMLDELLAAGLPHAETARRQRFAECDLHYLALRLGRAPMHLQAMRWWTASLVQAASCDALRATIHCVAYAPVGAEVDFCDPAGIRRTRVEADRGVGHLELTTVTAWPSLDPAIAALLSQVAALDFCWIPAAVPDTVELARRTGLADCESSARLLVQECAKLGVAARTAYGLLLASPYSTPHNWAEILIEDRWTPVDPLLLALLHRYAGLDGAAWPPSRSPGGVLLRIADGPHPLASAGGQTVDLTFLTTLREAQPATIDRQRRTRAARHSHGGATPREHLPHAAPGGE